MLETIGLSVYANHNRDKSEILKKVNFKASLGEMVAIIGPSGCGKSTFLKAIAGLARHVDGRINWLDREIARDYDIEPETLAYVPQFSIFHEELTVEEILSDAAVLRLGRLTENHARVREVAELTGLEDLFQRKAKVLSGGQRRSRAAFLRREWQSDGRSKASPRRHMGEDRQCL